ncbi:MAG TPA: nitroreductase family protein, partial [Caulobacteraceae bacterium]|nr:nitroreductase family protein [Caulobacteraceae bacterium]
DTSLMSLKDCCLAAENLMLAAYDRGMGTCWIGFSETWLDSPQGRAELGIRPDCAPVAPIILGRPTGLPPRPHRNPPTIRRIAAPGVAA